MTLSVELLQEQNVEQMARLFFTAFEHDPAHKIVFPKAASPDAVTHEATRFRQEMATDGKPGQTKWHRVVVDDSTTPPQAISYACFELTTPPTDPNADIMAGRTVPEDANQEAWDILAIGTARWRNSLLEQKSFLYLSILATEEEARGRGAGIKLIEWGKQKAQELSLPLVIQSHHDNINFYKRRGMTVLGEKVKDFSKWAKLGT